MKGDFVYLLRPNWKVTNIKENLFEELKYSYNDGKLKIPFREILPEKPVINFYDLTGKLIPDTRFQFFKYELGIMSIYLNISFLPKGIYFVEIIFSRKKYTLKVLKNLN